VKTLSLITASFNRERTIRDTLRSVNAQDYGDIEHIIIDGGSTDGTVDILKQYVVRWISEADRGQSHAVNKGLALASGDIIGWLNADDVYSPGAISAG